MKKLAITFALLLGAMPTNYAMEQGQNQSSQLPEQIDEALQRHVSFLSNPADEEENQSCQTSSSRRFSRCESFTATDKRKLIAKAFTTKTIACACIQASLEELVQEFPCDPKTANNFNNEIMGFVTTFFDDHNDNEGCLRLNELKQSFVELPEGYFKMMVRLVYHELFQSFLDDCKIDIINRRFYKENGELSNEITLAQGLVPQKYLFGVVEWLRVHNALRPIIFLDLGENTLTHLCPELRYLPLLKKLVCSGNCFKALPKDIIFMPSLTNLVIALNEAGDDESFERFYKELRAWNKERNALCVISLEVRFSQKGVQKSLVRVSNFRIPRTSNRQ